MPETTPKSDKFLFFYSHKPLEVVGKNCLSQWFPCRITDDMFIEYNCAEQYMMSKKALLFEDYETNDLIMQERNPSCIKALGRKVKNFDSDLWDAAKHDVVYKGNLMKFEENGELGDFLLSTGDAILAEASPYDKIWGIGMSEDEWGINEPENWEGQNILGNILMAVRKELKTIRNIGNVHYTNMH